MWIRISGIPTQWKTTEVGWKISKLFPKYLNVIMSENGSKEGKWIKLFAEIELAKPLLRGTKMQLDNECVWVEFSYEYLPDFVSIVGVSRPLGKIMQ